MTGDLSPRGAVFLPKSESSGGPASPQSLRGGRVRRISTTRGGTFASNDGLKGESLHDDSLSEDARARLSFAVALFSGKALSGHGKDEYRRLRAMRRGNQGGFRLLPVPTPPDTAGSKGWLMLRKELKNIRASWAKDELRSFQFFMDLQENVQQQLLDVVRFAKLEAATALYMQGSRPGIDDPGDCYVIMSGEVHIWNLSDEDRREAQPTLLESSFMSTTGSDHHHHSPHDRRNSMRSQRSRQSAERRHSVFDGFSFGRRPSMGGFLKPTTVTPEEAIAYLHDGEETPEVQLGTYCASVSPGELLGHTALLTGERHNASYVTSAPTEVLIIKRQDFFRVLKSSLESSREQKGEFLAQHLPGLNRLPQVKREHALHNFRKVSYQRGHIFLEQGQAEEEMALYVLLKGHVEVHACGHRLGVLVRGAVFGTTSPGVPEDFTIASTSSSPVDVYWLKGRDVSKLPLSLKQDLFKHICNMRDWHLKRTIGALEFGSIPWLSCSTPQAADPFARPASPAACTKPAEATPGAWVEAPPPQPAPAPEKILGIGRYSKKMGRVNTHVRLRDVHRSSSAPTPAALRASVKAATGGRLQGDESKAELQARAREVLVKMRRARPLAWDPGYLRPASQGSHHSQSQPLLPYAAPQPLANWEVTSYSSSRPATRG